MHALGIFDLRSGEYALQCYKRYFFHIIVNFNPSKYRWGRWEQTWDLHGKRLDRKPLEGPKVLTLPDGNKDRSLWI